MLRLAVLSARGRLGAFTGALKDKPAECPGRRAPMAAHENTGTDLLLDLTGVPCEP